EILAIELQHFPAPATAGHNRHVIDVILVRHGGHGGRGVLIRELTLEVPFPKRDQALLRGGERIIHGDLLAFSRFRNLLTLPGRLLSFKFSSGFADLSYETQFCRIPATGPS